LDIRLQRVVAVKIMNASAADMPRFVKQLAIEAQHTASLNHPNIVSVYDLGEDNGDEYIVLEFVAGRTLRAILNEGRLPIDRAINYALQLADGLAAAHRRGILHCDIKPQNVLVSDREEVKIADFGVSRAAATVGALTSQAIVGTLDYLAPEQIEGNKPNERSDIYALGLIIYEMLAGELPFARDETPAQTLAQKVANDPRPLIAMIPEAKPQISAVVMRALQRNPAARYSSAEQLSNALKLARSPDAPEATPAVAFDAPTVTITPPASVTTRQPASKKKETPSLAPVITVLTLVAVSALVFLTALSAPRSAAVTNGQSNIGEAGGERDHNGIGGGMFQLGSAIIAALTSPTSTATLTPTKTATSTPRPTGTPTSTPAPSSTATRTPSPTATATPVPVRMRNSTLTIRKRSAESVSLSDLSRGSILEGGFTVQGGNDDIGFAIVGPDGTNLVNIERVRSRYDFRVLIQQPGKYTLIFDNRFSWVTNKVVAYSLRY
jgi:serine/threonine protein kinase